nr:hypothetical protein [Methanobrevibacter arboriphilus]
MSMINLGKVTGNTPYIEDGYWYIDGENTGVKATGEKGDPGDFDRLEFIDSIYPVGSVYMNFNEINPSEIFGVGTWEKIENQFLIGASDSRTSGSIGGSEVVTLNESQMPSHGHSVSVTSSGSTTSGSTTPSATGSAGSHTHDAYARVRNLGSGSFSVREIVTSGNSEEIKDVSNAGSHTHTSAAHTHSIPNHTHTVSQDNKGSGQPHDNMPPYVAINMWKRIS